MLKSRLSLRPQYSQRNQLNQWPFRPRPKSHPRKATAAETTAKPGVATGIIEVETDAVKAGPEETTVAEITRNPARDGNTSPRTMRERGSLRRGRKVEVLILSPRAASSVERRSVSYKRKASLWWEVTNLSQNPRTRRSCGLCTIDSTVTSTTITASPVTIDPLNPTINLNYICSN
jgi:hypothetical protein